jgi:hypothetical protein
VDIITLPSGFKGLIAGVFGSVSEIDERVSNNEIVDSDFIDAHDDIKAYFNESRWNR